MRESGYYPPGAEFDPNAPYNQCDPPEIELSVKVTEVMVKDSVLITNNAWYVDDEEGGHYLEDTNLEPCKEWSEQEDILPITLQKAKEEITNLRIEAQEQQKKLEAHYGVRHGVIPGCRADDTFMMKMRKHLWDAMERVRKLKALEEALDGWEQEEIEVEY